MLGFNYLSAILDPIAMDATMEKAMLNCGLNVCDNDSMSMFEGCPNKELLELLKTKKHAIMFVHMLKFLENENLTSCTIVYVNLIHWLRSIKEEIEYCLIRLII